MFKVDDITKKNQSFSNSLIVLSVESIVPWVLFSLFYFMDTFIFYPNPAGDDQHVLLHTIRAQNPSAGSGSEDLCLLFSSALFYFAHAIALPPSADRVVGGQL